MSIYLICQICNKKHQNIRAIAQHVSTHNHSSKSYYDTFFKKTEEGFCLDCKKETRWQNLKLGYLNKCSSCKSRESAINQWFGEKGEQRKQKLSIKMKDNTFSKGRPKGSKNKNKYPEGAASIRAIHQFTQYGHNWLGKKHKYKTIEKMSESAIKRIEKMGPPKSYKGKFYPKNPKKYRGNLDNIIWRSTWELRFFKYLDENSNILEWSSEEIIISYISPVDGKYHRYFPDVFLKARQPDNSIKSILAEIKPQYQTVEPVKKSRVTKQYITEVVTYGVNQAKWKAAREYCADRGWEFRLITEKELGIK